MESSLDWVVAGNGDLIIGRGVISRMRVGFGIAIVECYDKGFGNAPGRNDSSNRKRFSLLKSVYSNLSLWEE